jgi:hypothetical protein
VLTYLQTLQANANSGTKNILIGQHGCYYPPGWYSPFAYSASYCQLAPVSGPTAANVLVPQWNPTGGTSGGPAQGSTGSNGGWVSSGAVAGTSTGQTPAILGITCGTSTPGASIGSDGGTVYGLSGSHMDCIGAANDWLSTTPRGIVALTSVFANPVTNTQANGTVNIANVLTTGNQYNTKLLSYIDAFAAIVKQINGTVLFRMFPEWNGGWFWYGNTGNGGNASNTQQIALWNLARNRLIADGVTNVLYTYNVNGGVGNYGGNGSGTGGPYPGSSVVDVVSLDSYTNTPGQQSVSDGSYTALGATGKPMIIFEAGVNSAGSQTVGGYNNYSQYESDVIVNAPHYIGIIFWTQTQALSQQLGANTVMGASQSIVRSALPPLD